LCLAKIERVIGFSNYPLILIIEKFVKPVFIMPLFGHIMEN
jgi:hypothetical protein